MHKYFFIFFTAMVSCFASPAFAFEDSVFALEGISRMSESSFVLGHAGVYQVQYISPTSVPAQRALRLNGEQVEGSVYGTEMSNVKIKGNCIIGTSENNSVLELFDPATNLPITISISSPDDIQSAMTITRLK